MVKGPILLPRVTSALALTTLLLLSNPNSALAAEGGSTVSGTVALPAVSARKASPRRGQGFVPRAKNHLRPPNGFDPRSRIVIVLQGGPVDETDRKARDSHYNIVGENFETDILPVVVGGRISITNMGRKAPRLYSLVFPKVVPSDPINKTGDRKTKAIAEKHKEIDIRDHDSVHFLAHIVAFEHSYFSTVNNRGQFEIKGVPAGTWNLKVWHHGGWVTNVDDMQIVVTSKKDAKGNKVVLPKRLKSTSDAQ
ncbi:MAG: hypothetical protein JKY56_26310 [Kofleriaceae bacterium]|nr:hypothetical protein [Kofleriaceae bacterium]